MMMTSYLYKHGKQSNSHFFMQGLLNHGLGCYTIALGARLTVDTIIDVVRQRNLELDILSFEYLLGFYCSITKVKLLPKNKKFKVVDAQFKQSALFKILLHQPWQYLKESKNSLKLFGPAGKQSYLTVREQQVLFFLLQAVSREICACYLNISLRTVEFHWYNIKNRLNICKLADLYQLWQPLASG